jgi:alpha-soluble NSF attachment protein
MYPTFSDSRECKLLKLLLDKLEENDVEGFTEAVKDYDSISRLDQWFTNILLRIKRQIEADSDMK